jgi:Putative metal-binding motif
MLRRALRWAVASLLLAPAVASAGTFGVQGSTLVYTGEDGVDQIAGFDTGTSIRFTRFGGVALGGGPGCSVSADAQSVDCPKGAITRVQLNLGGGDDVAAVSANVTVPVSFDGGDGNDGLFGGGGTDGFAGGSGNDNIVSRDGKAEQVDCGAGLDTAISDDADSRSSCEEIEGDADGDGVRRPADCNDTTPAIHPGAVDVPDDGVDQDCSGTDATNLDADGDGSPRPLDCNDSNRAIRPGAREIVGNRVDENCDTEAVPFRGIGGVLRNLWLPAGSRTVNGLLTARDFPSGTRIELRCSGSGCGFRKVVRKVKGRRGVRLHRFFGSRSLGPGARVTVQLTHAGRIGRVLRFRISSTPGVPSVEVRCKPPGKRVRDC